MASPISTSSSSDSDPDRIIIESRGKKREATPAQREELDRRPEYKQNDRARRHAARDKKKKEELGDMEELIHQQPRSPSSKSAASSTPHENPSPAETTSASGFASIPPTPPSTNKPSTLGHASDPPNTLSTITLNTSGRASASLTTPSTTKMSNPGNASRPPKTSSKATVTVSSILESHWWLWKTYYEKLKKRETVAAAELTNPPKDVNLRLLGEIIRCGQRYYREYDVHTAGYKELANKRVRTEALLATRRELMAFREAFLKQKEEEEKENNDPAEGVDVLTFEPGVQLSRVDYEGIETVEMDFE